MGCWVSYRIVYCISTPSHDQHSKEQPCSESVLQNHTTTSRTLIHKMDMFAVRPVSPRTVRRRLQRHELQKINDQYYGFTWRCNEESDGYSGAPNNKGKYRSQTTSSFQTGLGATHCNLTVYVTEDSEVNARRLLTFDIDIRTMSLAWMFEQPLNLRHLYLWFRLMVIWT